MWLAVGMSYGYGCGTTGTGTGTAEQRSRARTAVAGRTSTRRAEGRWGSVGALTWLGRGELGGRMCMAEVNPSPAA